MTDGPLLVVEPNPRGHRLYYVRLLAEHAITQGRHVTLLTLPAAVTTAEWSLHLAGLDRLSVVHPPSGQIEIEDIERASEAASAATVTVPDGDRLLTRLLRHGWKGSGSLKVLAMRTEPQGRVGGRAGMAGVLRKTLIGAVGRRQRVHTYALRSPWATTKFPLRWVPDPVTLSCRPTDLAAAREHLDAYGTHYWVGIFGSITVRKNLSLVADAVLAVPGAALVVMGNVDDDARMQAAGSLEALRAAQRPVVEISGAITDAALDAMISSVDCVVAAHSNEGPSGIVSKAAVANRHIVAAGARSLRRDCRDLGDLAKWSELRVDAMAENIASFQGKPSANARVTASAGDFVLALT